jgi:acyl dehydratase
MAKALHFDELADHVDTHLGMSNWILIDQPMIDAFANLTGDHQWVHVDVERAAREVGGTFAHGLLTLSLLPRISAEILTITGISHGLNYGLGKVRFLNKVMAGSWIRGRLRLTRVEPKNGGLLLGFEATIEIERQGRPACVAETLTLVYGDERKDRHKADHGRQEAAEVGAGPAAVTPVAARGKGRLQ